MRDCHECAELLAELGPDPATLPASLSELDGECGRCIASYHKTVRLCSRALATEAPSRDLEELVAKLRQELELELELPRA